MPKILVNYIYNKKTDKFKLSENEYVFADMPVAEMDLGFESDDILVVPINNKSTVVDRISFLSKNKLFKLKANGDGTLTEDPNGTPVYLPKETDVNLLRLIDGKLVLLNVEDENDEENKEK